MQRLLPVVDDPPDHDDTAASPYTHILHPVIAPLPLQIYPSAQPTRPRRLRSLVYPDRAAIAGALVLHGNWLFDPKSEKL
jgi:hypothetical protein